MMKSCVLVIEELSVGRYLGKCIRNLQEHEFPMVGKMKWQIYWNPDADTLYDGE